jgi:hypothetical protein
VIKYFLFLCSFEIVIECDCVCVKSIFIIHVILDFNELDSINIRILCSNLQVRSNVVCTKKQWDVIMEFVVKNPGSRVWDFHQVRNTMGLVQQCDGVNREILREF